MTATTKVRGKKPQGHSLNILCEGIWMAVSRGLRTQAPDVWVQSGEADVQGKAISQEAHAASRGFSQMNGSYRLPRLRPSTCALKSYAGIHGSRCHRCPPVPSSAFPLKGMSNVGKPGITRGQINYFWLLLAAYSLHQNMSALNQSVKQQATRVPKPRATCSQTTELSSTKGSLMWLFTGVACSREFHL